MATDPAQLNQTRAPDDSIAGPSRRTVLASERTWLAWFRTGIAVSAAAIAVGGVIPHLVEGSQWPYIVLGVGYAILAAAVFVYGWIRHRQITAALERNADLPTGVGWMFGLTAYGAVLALATLAMVVIDARTGGLLRRPESAAGKRFSAII